MASSTVKLQPVVASAARPARIRSQAASLVTPNAAMGPVRATRATVASGGQSSLFGRRLAVPAPCRPADLRRTVAPSAALAQEPPSSFKVSESVLPLPGGGRLVVEVADAPNGPVVTLQVNAEGEYLLHWGLVHNTNSSDWIIPPKLKWPPATRNHKDRALQTAIPATGIVSFQVDPAARLLEFALKNETTGEWIKRASGNNFSIMLPGIEAPPASASWGAEESTSPTPTRIASPADSPQGSRTTSPARAAGWRSELATVGNDWRDELRPDNDWRDELRVDPSDEENSRRRNRAPSNSSRSPPPPAPASSTPGFKNIRGQGIQADPLPVTDAPPPPPPAAAAAPLPTTDTPPPPPPAADASYQSARDVAEGLAAEAAARSGGAQPIHTEACALGVHGTVLVNVYPTPGGGGKMVCVSDCPAPLFAHWAVSQSSGATWRAPPGPWSTNPPRSSDGGGGAWDSEFETSPGGLQAMELEFQVDALRSSADAKGVTFVLCAGGKDWLKHADDRDFWVPLPVPEGAPKAHRREKKNRRDRRGPEPGPVAPKGEAAAAAAKDAFERAEAAGGKGELKPIRRTRTGTDGLECGSGRLGDGGWGGNVPDWMVNDIANAEDGCRRSLMHRYNTAADLLENAIGSQDAEAAVGALYTWMRYMSLRQLIINRNYNIKPRELSAAQDKLTKRLATLQRERPELREVNRLLMSAVGRGGQGDVGQRIRDEILSIQQRNGCKGGMMEEWHQKLHNNTCPDDVVICQALLDHIAAGLDMGAYWATLHAEGITAERLLSYDRAIHSEPNFSPDQCEGLTRDLKEYMRTLKAVHSGADLDSAAETVLGYYQPSCKGKEINVPPVDGVASDELAELLTAATHPDAISRPLVAAEAMVEARRYLRPWTANGGGAELGDRLKEVVYLDLALEGQVRAVVERSLQEIRGWGLADVLLICGLALENLCLASGQNQELVSCLRDWQSASSGGGGDLALKIKAVVDRVRTVLGQGSERYMHTLQPTAGALGGRLGCDQHVVDLFSEEAVRGTAAAPLSQLLNVLEPLLREAADMGRWQVISNTAASGRVVYVERLADVQWHTYDEPTIVVAGRVGGEEELPEGAVAVVTADMPDVLSHISVRARNEKALFGTCFDPEVLASIRAMDGQWAKLEPTAKADDMVVTALDAPVASPRLEAAAAAAAAAAAPTASADSAAMPAAIVQRSFAGEFAVSSQQFTDALVGGKSRNLSGLRGKVPEWVGLPASAALPYGVCEEVLKDPINEGPQRDLQAALADIEAGGDIEANLAIARAAVSQARAPLLLVAALKRAFEAEALPWPGHGQGWNAAWAAITQVWASKFNERAFISCRKAGLRHDDLRMAVLCQEVVNPRYAFVAHTVNPTTGDAGEVYVELVQGLGECLVGNYPGNAMSFSARKDDLDNPKILGYPSKSVGLFPPGPTMIFRSDSNGEDLEGYAGAGLYDSVTMEPADERMVDYGSDPLMSHPEFQRATMAAVARACVEVENALGGVPQDIEGVLTPEGRLYVVQTRPQVG